MTRRGKWSNLLNYDFPATSSPTHKKVLDWIVFPYRVYRIKSMNTEKHTTF